MPRALQRLVQRRWRRRRPCRACRSRSRRAAAPAPATIVGARLAGDQDAAHRAGVADAQRGLAARALGRRAVGEVGRWHSVVWTPASPRARQAVEQRARSARSPRQQRDVVAERCAEAAGLDEVALHVDDDQRRSRRAEGVVEGRRRSAASAALRRAASRHPVHACPAHVARRSLRDRPSSARRLVDDPAVGHHDDAVGQLEDLVEVLADQQHRRAAVARLR